MQDNRYQRLFISMRYWLLGVAESNVGYLHTLTALQFAQNIHTGFRKDNVTPEFQHQIEIAHFIRTLNHHLIDPANTLATIFLHDTLEDYAQSHNISVESLTKKFNKTIADAVLLMSKIRDGQKINNKDYYDAMALCPIASVAKGADRINNLMTMHPVFSYNKQREYIQETREFVLPMLKEARRNFPQQEGVYENIKLFINNTINLSEHRLNLEEKMGLHLQ